MDKQVALIGLAAMIVPVICHYLMSIVMHPKNKKYGQRKTKNN